MGEGNVTTVIDLPSGPAFLEAHSLLLYNKSEFSEQGRSAVGEESGQQACELATNNGSKTLLPGTSLLVG